MGVNCVYYDPAKRFCKLGKDICNHEMRYTCFYERTEQGDEKGGDEINDCENRSG
jgi:hypothetical protein